MEKHWKSVISRSICDYFFDAQNKATSPSEVRIQIELFVLDLTIITSKHKIPMVK